MARVDTHLSTEATGRFAPGARSILDAMDSPTVVLAPDGRIALTNEAWDATAHRRGARSVDIGLDVDYLAVCDRAALAVPIAADVAAAIRSVLEGLQLSADVEYALDGPGGTRWCKAQVTRLSNGGVLVSHHDVTDARLLELELRRRTTQDRLTGLANRNQFLEQTRLSLYGRGDVGVAVCDLDEFKVVNELHGDQGGDDLLTQAAARLRAAAHPEDLVARLGGDTFAVLCPGLDDPHLLGDRIASTLAAEPFMVGGEPVSITASVGIRWVSLERCSAEAAMRDADTALHEAKRLGRNQVRVFDEVVARASTRRLSLETALRQASDGAGFHLVYQPQVDLTNGRVVGLEALLRWEHGGEPVSPAEFIPIAEEIGTIAPLGAWVVEEACRQMSVWRDAGLREPVSITVNLSPRQLADHRLVEHVTSCLERYDVPANTFCLELTESALMLGGEVTNRVLEQLRDTGLNVGIDDFGTGYSSLGQLRSLPVDVLKVDRSFVEALGSDDAAGPIVNAIIALAASMSLRVVAEGVETTAQARELLDLGCSVVQGWLFAPGLSSDLVQGVCEAGFGDLVAA